MKTNKYQTIFLFLFCFGLLKLSGAAFASENKQPELSQDDIDAMSETFADSGIENSKASEELCDLTTSSTPNECAIEHLENLIPDISTSRWRDQSYRELAKIYMAAGKLDNAILQFDNVNNPDTKAMTLRAIAFALTKLELDDETLNNNFDKLKQKALEIDHKGARQIAFTYLAIGEANAGLTDRALNSAREMNNEDLKNKAYAEIGEIIAKHGSSSDALIAIQHISNKNYKNKAYATLVKILIIDGHFNDALKAANKINDPYIKSDSLIAILKSSANNKSK